MIQRREVDHGRNSDGTRSEDLVGEELLSTMLSRIDGQDFIVSGSVSTAFDVVTEVEKKMGDVGFGAFLAEKGISREQLVTSLAHDIAENVEAEGRIPTQRLKSVISAIAGRLKDIFGKAAIV